jgi:hypothetical protein
MWAVWWRWWGVGPVGVVAGDRVGRFCGVMRGAGGGLVAVCGQASRGVSRRGLVERWGGGRLCQPAGEGSVLRRANAVVSSLAQGQFACIRSVAVRAWNARRAATCRMR